MNFTLLPQIIGQKSPFTEVTELEVQNFFKLNLKPTARSACTDVTLSTYKVRRHEYLLLAPRRIKLTKYA